MSISWQTVAVPLVGGLDTKTDAKAVLPTKLTLLENGEFTKGGSLRKRPGYAQKPAILQDGTPVTGLRNVFSRGAEEVTASHDSLYSRNQFNGRLFSNGPYDPVTHECEEVAQVSAEQTLVDCASYGGVTVYAWQDSRGGVRGAVFYEDTGACIESDWQIATSDAERPKVVAVGGNILVFYYQPTTDNILCRVVNPLNVVASLAVASVTTISDLATTGIYDVTSDGTSAYIFYATDGSVVTGSRLAKVNPSGVAVLFATVIADVITQAAVTYNRFDGIVYTAWYDSVGVFAASHYASNLVVVGSVGTVDAAVANVVNVAAAPSGKQPSASRYGVHILYEVSAASTANHITHINIDFFNTRTVTSVRHAGLGSAGWERNSYGYIILTYESRTGVQHGYFLLRLNPGSTGTANGTTTIVGRVLSGEGVGVHTSDHLPGPTVLDDDRVMLALGFRRKLEIKDLTSPAVPGNAVFSHKGIKQVVFDHGATPQGAEFGKSLYLTGSQLWNYDSVGAVETGFHMFPDLLSSDITTTGTADADITAGAYSYRVYYEWTNALGERCRSAAITRAHTTAGGNRLQLVIPTLTYTNKLETLGRSDISIVVYRTEVNANQLFYRVSSASPTAGMPNGYLENNPAADTVTFTDGMSDATLLTQELDYQSTGERPNLGPEGCTYLAVVQNRLWLVGGGQFPERVRYSKLRFDGQPAEFFGGYISEAPQYGGRTVAMGYVNESPVIFKETAIYTLDGEGPDNAGAAGSYIPKPISADTGTSEPGSVLPVAEGVFFKSPEGIQLLDQSGNISYIGAEVEAYNGQTFVRALGIPNTNQLLFLTDDGVSLMYDTFYKQWSTFTNHEGLGATQIGTTFAYMLSNGTVYYRDTAAYHDAGVYYKFKFRTAPLHLKDELQGFWRCRRVGVVGDYVSPHNLICSVYYDRDQAPFEVFTWSPDEVLELDAWGDGAYWGSDSFWGGSAGSRDYRFNHRLKRQKCETIRFEFEDDPSGSTPGASFELTELTLEVGIRDGLGRIPATRKV